MPNEDDTVGNVLLRPTRIYARAIAELIAAGEAELRGIAHITGGGLPDNVPRILLPGLVATIRLDSFRRPRLFTLIQEGGPVEESELRRTFNLGVGLVAALAPTAVDRALAALGAAGEDAWVLGELEEAAEAGAPASVRFVGKPK